MKIFILIKKVRVKNRKTFTRLVCVSVASTNLINKKQRRNEVNMNRCDFDERQNWIRGDIYKHVIIYMAIMLLVDAFLSDYGIIWAEGRYSSIIILYLPVMAGLAEMFLKDVYIPGCRGRNDFIFGFMGILSVSQLIWTIKDMISQKIGMMEGNHLSDSGAVLVLNIPATIVFLIFIYKYRNNKRGERMEEEA